MASFLLPALILVAAACISDPRQCGSLVVIIPQVGIVLFLALVLGRYIVFEPALLMAAAESSRHVVRQRLRTLRLRSQKPTRDSRDSPGDWHPVCDRKIGSNNGLDHTGIRRNRVLRGDIARRRRAARRRESGSGGSCGGSRLLRGSADRAIGAARRLESARHCAKERREVSGEGLRGSCPHAHRPETSGFQQGGA